MPFPTRTPNSASGPKWGVQGMGETLLGWGQRGAGGCVPTLSGDPHNSPQSEMRCTDEVTSTEGQSPAVLAASQSLRSEGRETEEWMQRGHDGTQGKVPGLPAS